MNEPSFSIPAGVNHFAFWIIQSVAYDNEINEDKIAAMTFGRLNE